MADDTSQDDTLRSRIARLVGIAEAARSTQSELDLVTAQFELGQDMMSASEVGIMLGFVQGSLDEKRTTELLTAAQSQQDATKLVEAATANGNLDARQAEVIVEQSQKQPEFATRYEEAKQEKEQQEHAETTPHQDQLAERRTREAEADKGGRGAA